MHQKKSQLNKSGKKTPLRIAAGFMALCTVLTLGIPAIALETKDPVCGLDHEHTAVCYPAAEKTEKEPDLSGKVLHKHNKFCYDSAHAVICPMPEFEEHTHKDGCYETVAAETEPAAEPHVHTDECYTAERGAQICAVLDTDIHTHTDACYETVARENTHEHTDSCYTRQQKELTCALAEQEGHSHGGGCYVSGDAPVCGAEESEAHTHGSSCYEKVLSCAEQEIPGHAHNDGCYAWENTLICDAETESSQPAEEKILICTEPVHTHSDECFEWVKVLTCGMEELPPEDTTPAEPEKVLTCKKIAFQNHIHGESCYETDDSGNTTLICTRIQLQAHQHQESCLGLSAEMLLCETEESEEHTHSYSCYSSWSFLCQLPAVPEEKPEEVPAETSPKKPESDPKADLEYPSDWEKTVAHVKLTGAWSHDVLAIAQSQLGYKESKRNFVIYRNGDQKGYTRYGQWYGFPYGDWCAMFASFCLNYAGIKDFPLDCNCAHWIDVLTESNLYATSDIYTPKSGDLVFFDHGRVSATAPRVSYGADHVAIVAGIIPATAETAAKLITIEGNHNNRVCYESRPLYDPTIIGYGTLPDGPAAIYSCHLPAHTHESVCYDEGENIDCHTQEHTHTDSCRNRTLRFTDGTVQGQVKLTNAVSVPENLRLDMALMDSSGDPAYASMMNAIDNAMADVKDALIFRMELMADGQPYRLPLGVQAEVQISFRQPALTAEGDGKLHTLMLTAEAESCQTAQVLSAEYEVKDDRVTGAWILADQVSDFALILAP